jgi:hypothetical protein
MNARRQFFGAIGLGSLLAGVTAAVPGEVFAATEQPRPAPQPTPAKQRPEYKVFTVPAGDNVEDAFNGLARDGFQYAGSTPRYGHTEFIFVKWVPADPTQSVDVSSAQPRDPIRDARRSLSR